MKGCAVATLVVLALWLSGTARARGSDWPAPLPAQASAQQATTEQAGMANADATDAQPTNIFVSLRVNSPGDDGPVTQTATTAVAGDTSNDAATDQEASQDWAPGARPTEQASAQDSGTTQAAAASAKATRPKPTNVVLSVRVNSPGDDGPVTQSSTVAVAAQSKNTAATAQQAQQAATAPTAAAPPAPGAVADRQAAPSAPVSCVNVAPGTDATRIVITLGKSCRHVAPRRTAAAPKTREAPIRAAAPPPVSAPPAPPTLQQTVARSGSPVVHAAPAVSQAPPASSPPRIALKPRPAPAAPRLHVDPLAASARVANLVAAAPVPRPGEAQYEVMLALLLAMLGAAAVWSYGGVHRYGYRFRRWR
jgi:hypothetical protein